MEFRENKTSNIILMESMLNQVPAYGWTWKALYEGASTVKEFKTLDKRAIQALFDDNISNVIKLFNERLDQDMINLFDKNLNKELGLTQKVRQLILFRLYASKDYKEVIKSSFRFMGLPANYYSSLEQLLTTCNKIWNAAGDNSTGANFFSKRLILAAVYSTTLGYWLASANRSNEQTEKFLDKRLEDVKNLGKVSKSSYEYLEKVKTNLFNILGQNYNG